MIWIILTFIAFGYVLYYLSHLNPEKGGKENTRICLWGMFLLGMFVNMSLKYFRQDYLGLEKYVEICEQYWIEFPWIAWVVMGMVAVRWAILTVKMVGNEVEGKP